jgi:hypothetical protein
MKEFNKCDSWIGDQHIKKSILFLCTINEYSKSEIKKTFSFTIASKE